MRAGCTGAFVFWTGLAMGCAYAPIPAAPELTSLPSLPDPDRVDACEACAREECSAPRAACLEDDRCRELLECKSLCADPGCLQTCTAEHGYSAWYDDFWACVLTDDCATPCMAGESFACVDGYEAPRAAEDSGRFPVSFHFKNPRTGLAYAYPGDQRDEQFLVGASAKSCAPQEWASSECQLIDSGKVDVSNTVQLDLTVHQVMRRYTGLIEVELEDPNTAAPDQFSQIDWRERFMPPAFAQATEFRFYVFWRAWFRDRVIERSGEVLDFEKAAPLALYLEDCMGAPAHGVRFELLEQQEIDVLHQLSDGSIGDETDTGSALVGDIPGAARNIALTAQAVQVATGKVVAQRHDIYVRMGWNTHVWLSPSPAR